jgi:precorrin-2 dehydrogenase / sirohydrochlorin ferrochelatase
MKKKYFPCALNVADRPCVVIGSNQESFDRASRLKSAGARVTRMENDFSPSDLLKVENLFYVVLCIKDNPVLTKEIADICRKNKILLCAIDQPDYCDVVNVSIYERQDLKISISTNGVSPALAKKVRLGLEGSLLNAPLERFTSHLAALREKLEKEIPEAGERIRRLINAVHDVDFKATLKLPGKKSFWEKSRKTGGLHE